MKKPCLTEPEHKYSWKLHRLSEITPPDEKTKSQRLQPTK